MSEEEHGGKDSLDDLPTKSMNADSVWIPNLGDETIEKLIPQLVPKSADTSPGAFSPLPDLEHMQSLFPRLEVLELLGAGGMGAVFKARQKKLDRMVAVKILSQALSGDPEFVARFEREARAMARLDHPNIVTIYDFGEREGFYFFIMEFVDGGDLHKLIQQKKADPAVVLDLIPQICEAVQFAHDEGITHRDIKPANILLDQKGRVKVADFGLAKIVEGDADSFQTMAGAGMGTPFYMAPEQMTDADTVDQRADIYSLGVVIYQLITGNLPQGDFPRPSQAVPEVSVNMDQAIMRAMAQDPALRFSEVKELFEALEIVREGKRAKRDSEEKSGKGGLVAVLVMVFLAVIGGVAFWLKPWENDSGISSGSSLQTESDLAFRGIDHPDMVNGRLRGVGNVPNLEKFAAYDDIVQVGSQYRQGPLVILRSGGQVFSEKGKMYPKDVARISQFRGFNPAFLYSDGSVLSNSVSGFPVPNAERAFVEVYCLKGGGDVVGGLGLLKDGSVQPFGLSDWRAFPPRMLSEVSHVAHWSDFTAVLSGGTVFTWGPDGEVSLPQAFDQNVVDIAMSDRNLYGLDVEGNCFVANGEGHQSKLPWQNKGDVIALSSRCSTPLHQTKDGNWHFTEDKTGAKLKAALPNLKGLPPEAFFVGDFEDKEYLVWIEPVDKRGKAEPELTAPKIELPPALAAMKQRGGRLQVWGNSTKGTDLAKTIEGVSLKNLVRVRGGTGGFVAMDSLGRVRFRVPHEFDGESALDFDFPSIFVSDQGQPVSNDPHLKDLVPQVDGKAIVSVKTGSNRLAALTRDGSVHQVFDKSIETEHHRQLARELAEMDDVVSIELASTQGIGLRSNGTVFMWGDQSERVTRAPDNVKDIVAVQASLSFLALSRDGKVHTWGWSSSSNENDGLDVPSDLGKAYQIRANDSGVSAAQMADGHWKAWGTEDGGVVDFINTKMGPAVDLDFSIKNEAGGFAVWWIEPIENTSRESDVEIGITKNLPPVLAAMKQRGGRLRAWGKIRSAESGKLIPINVEPLKNHQFRKTAGGGGEFYWMETVDGTWIRSYGTGDFTEMPDVKDVRIVDGNNIVLRPDKRAFAMRSIGTFAEDVVDFSAGTGHGYAVRSNGTVAGVAWSPDVQKYLQDFVEPLTDIIGISQNGWRTSALKRDGTVLTWNADPQAGVEFTTTPEEVRDVVSVAAPNAALHKSGALFLWDSNGKLLPNPPVPGPAVDLRSWTCEDGRTGYAAQMLDGIWTPWTVDESQKVSGPDSIGEQLIKCGKAMDIGFVETGGKETGLLWIEPIEEASGESTVETGFFIKLPPTIAAMKERGGRMRAWGKTLKGTPLDLSKAEGINNFTKVECYWNTMGEWAASTPYGSFSSKSGQDSQIIKTRMTSGVVTAQGNLLANSLGPGLADLAAKLPAGSVSDFAEGNIWGMVELKSGNVIPIYLPVKNDAKQLNTTVWKEISKVLGEVSDSVQIEADSNSGMILKSDGTVLSFNIDKGMIPPPDGLKNVIQVACGNNLFLALTSDREVFAWTAVNDSIRKEVLAVPKFGQPVVNLRAGAALAAAQLYDGTWKAWGENVEGMVDRINSLGPLVDLDIIGGHPALINLLMWIEPNLDGKKETVRASAKMDLPPALAAMKERGGRLRGWSNTPKTKMDFGKAAEASNFSRTHVNGPRSGGWRAFTTEDEYWNAYDISSKRENAVDVGIYADGELFTTTKLVAASSGSEISFDGKPVQMADGFLDGLDYWMVIRTSSGRVVPFVRNAKDLADPHKSAWDKLEDRLQRERDVVAIAANLHKGMCLRSDGSVLVWDLKENTNQEISDFESPIVAVDCGGGAFTALNSDGIVFEWKANQEPKVVSAIKKPAVAVRANISNQQGGVAQMLDGSWVAWGLGSEVEKRVADIGPAVDLSVDVSSESKERWARILWIEPGRGSAAANEFSTPKLNIPAAMEAMKERGGTFTE